jgi:hypothetical protein
VGEQTARRKVQSIFSAEFGVRRLEVGHRHHSVQ